MSDEFTARQQRHQSSYRRPIRQADLLHPESRRGLVPQGVELLSGGRPRGPVRLDAGVQPRGPAHPARVGADHPLRASPASDPCLTGDALQPDRGRGYPRRAEVPGHPPAPLRADHRARLAAHGLTLPRDRLAPLLPRQEYSDPRPGPPTNATRSIWSGRSTSKAAASITSGWARMSSTAPSACGWRAPAAWTKSSGSSGSARGTWAGRRRSSWTTFASLSGWGPAARPLAGDPAVPVLRRRAGLHPGRGAAVQRRRAELQRLVPTPVVPATVHAAGRPSSGAGAAAGGRRHPARPPAARGLDAGAAPPEVTAVDVTRQLCGADGSAADRGGARDLVSGE